MKRFAGSILLLLTLLVSSWANDGWMVSSGGAYQFGKANPNIQMLSEDLRINLINGGANVEVRYVFKNHGPASEITIGFPEERGNVEGPGIRKLSSWIDGRPVRVQRKSLSADFDNRMYKVVWMKKVKFAANGSRSIIVRYETDLSGDTSETYGFYYTLITAKTWKLPIRDFRVTVDWTQMNDQSKPQFVLPGAQNAWKVSGWRRRTASLHNFVPRGDLELRMRWGFWNFRFNGKRVNMTSSYEDVIRGSRQDPMIRLRNCKTVLCAPPDYVRQDNSWSKFESKYFGGPFEVSDYWVKTADGKRHRLARASRLRFDSHENKRVPFIYIKDLVRALGGTFKYNRADERVDIVFRPRL